MRNRRIVIYGGLEIDEPVASFVIDLASAIVANETMRIATGGFAGHNSSGKSTEAAVVAGVKRYCSTKKVGIEECLETWLPEPARDKHRDERIHEGKQELLAGLSARSRRLRLVDISDAIVAIDGRRNTALVLEMAFAVGRPALPLPFTGGAAKASWIENESAYVQRFGIDKQTAKVWKQLDLGKLGDHERQNTINAVTRALATAIKRTCLVLLPFQGTSLWSVIESAASTSGFHPIRLDEDLFVGDVRTTITRLVREADAVVADITSVNPNVMYEIGLAHAEGRSPLLLHRGDLSVPFYLRPHRIASGTDEELAAATKKYLQDVKIFGK
jgi:hypothetical protein